MKELVDNTKEFLPVYALFGHEILGYLIGAYIVECNASRKLTLQYQRLLPDNFNQFQHKLDETDRKLTEILNQITLQNIYRQFKGKEASVQEFINGLIKHPHKDFILQFIEKRIIEALPLLTDRNFYRMSKDGYPAWKKLQFAPHPAQAVFRFIRSPKETRYSVTLKTENEKLDLLKPGVSALTESPLWMIVDNIVYKVEELERKKILPFITKEYISIPKAGEKEYYQKFLLKLLQKYEVKTEGITLITQTEEPKFFLFVNPAGDGRYRFEIRVKYGEIELPCEPKSKVIADVIFNQDTDNDPADEVKIIRIPRRTDKEQEISDLFHRIFGSDAQLFNLTLSENKALSRLTDHYGELTLAGIQIEVGNGAVPLNYEKPVLIPNASEEEDSFIFNPVVEIGDYRLSFLKLKEHILNKDPKIILPNGQVAILPESWFDDLEPIFEAARQTAAGWKLHSYHATLLQGIFTRSDPKLSDELEAFQHIEKQPPPAGLLAELREYQASGYDWMLFLQKFNLGGILADDMGLGKTIQTLSLLLHEKEKGIEKPSLVIVPNSLVFNWQHEIKKFTPALRTFPYLGGKRTESLNFINKYDLVITTYGTVRQDVDLLAEINFHYIVLDESQLIKNRDSKTTQAVLMLQSRYRLSLTGTPIENTTQDLRTQMQFLNPGLLGSAGFFEKFYAQPIERDRNETRRDKLISLVKPLILRRTKEMVATELPPSEVSVLYCEMTGEQQSLYNQTRKLYRSSLFQSELTAEEELSKNSIKIFSCLQRLRQIAIHPQMIDPMMKHSDSGKYEIMRHQLNVVLEEGSKVLIFSQFVKLLTIIKYDLTANKIKFAYLDGSTKNRGAEVEKFQENDDCKVFLISLKAGGVGLNLTAAQYVFILDPWWNPAIEQQAIARAHRIGQQKSVFGYKFITKNSIEEKILGLQEQKQRIAGEVIKSETAFFKSLSKDDLLSLFD